MTIDEIIQLCEDAKSHSGLPGTTRVIFGSQPHYPFANAITGSCIDHTFTADFLTFSGNAPREVALVLLEGNQLGYGNRRWWDGDDIHESAEERHDREVDEAYGEGKDCAEAGFARDNNPYSPAQEHHHSWNDGFDSVKKEEA